MVVSREYVCSSRSGRIYGMVRTEQMPTCALVDLVRSEVMAWAITPDQQMDVSMRAIMHPERLHVLSVVPWDSIGNPGWGSLDGWGIGMQDRRQTARPMPSGSGHRWGES